MIENPTYVYIIAPVDGDWPIAPVKVGITANLVGRLKSIQTGSPKRLSIVQAFPMPSREIAAGLEAAFHTVKKPYRTSGEWFDIDPLDACAAMAANIEAMLSSHLELEGEELEACLEISHVSDTRRRLVKAMAARDDEIIKAMT